MMKVGRMTRWMGLGLSVALALAACTPNDVNQTPGVSPEVETQVVIATDRVLETPEVTAAMPTEVMPTESLATSAPTEGAMTPEATTAATTEPNEMGEAGLLLSTELVGSQIVDREGNAVGDVMEVLVDTTGAVQYLVFDAGNFLDDEIAVATADPNATADPDALNRGIVAAPLSEFEVNTLMSTDAEFNEEQVLIYQGTAADLNTMAGFDLNVFDLDGFILDTTDTTLDARFDGLIRVSEFSDWNLVNATGEDLGEVEDLVIDLNQQAVLYGIVDFGGFLGIGEQSTAVPWNLFTIQQNADSDNQFQLDVTQATLENAPVVDLGAWPVWAERADGNTEWNLNWQNDANLFWDAAASS